MIIILENSSTANERLQCDVRMITAVKETTKAVAEKTEKETFLNRTRTQNRAIALNSALPLSDRDFRKVADSDFVLELPIRDVNRTESI